MARRQLGEGARSRGLGGVATERRGPLPRTCGVTSTGAVDSMDQAVKLSPMLRCKNPSLKT